MNINEVEKKLNVPRSNIRFYEKERMISVKRSDNGYRDYSDEDVERLKLIITLRKLGCTIEEIKSVLNGEKDIPDILKNNITRLKTSNEESATVLGICNEALLTPENFDVDKYFEALNTEQYHSKFERLIDEYWDWYSSGYAKTHELEGRKRSYVVLRGVLASVLFFIIKKLDYFDFSLMVTSVTISVITSFAVNFCGFLIFKKSPKTYKIIQRVWLVICIIVLICIYIFRFKDLVDFIMPFLVVDVF